MSPEPDEFLLPFFRGPTTITIVKDPAVNKLLVKEGKVKDLAERAKIIKETCRRSSPTCASTSPSSDHEDPCRRPAK